ncbi:putative spermidine/putrescine transport system substrate-binding protein [Rhodoligotrophos appendicifer]|uniref:ABC transporter substrate-binding protein n=1 Tax=Rhodoligotrophos appendicifer TaxID=987056 RepID=UPI001184C098|nr:PotD/PotF family extracellular solute-binding protein [Rhodoligotrophos appendicifer]
MSYSRRIFLNLVLISSITLGLGKLSVATAEDKSIVAVEWGGGYKKAMDEINETQDDVNVTFELHAGGAAAILAKIKAAWPETNYDVVAAWNPVFGSMISEEWIETVNAEEMSNLRDIPKALFMTDADGNLKAIPRSITGQHWGYRSDLCPFEITNIQDLLDDRLKGMVLFPAPMLNNNMQMVSIARALGGDEKNMEPAWDFVKELAKKGNIGRVSTSDSETFNSLSSGETCVGFSATTSFGRVAEVAPVVYLTKMPENSGFRTAIVMEGWAILKGGKTAEAKEWVNLMLSPENNEAFNASIGTVPVNSKSKASEKLGHITFTEEELAKYTFIPDWSYLSSNVNGWVQRWEKEVAPLL